MDKDRWPGLWDISVSGDVLSGETVREAADAAFAEQYARAREAQADALADEIVDIADGADSSGDAARDRLRIDARKWAAARLTPRKYGDAVKVETGAKGAPGAVVVFALPENGRDDDKS